MTLPTIAHLQVKPIGACDMINWTLVDWDDYERRVKILISEGMDRSDAEAVVDAELVEEQKEVDTASQ